MPNPTVVQAKRVGGGTFSISVTFDSTPTVGNLIVCIATTFHAFAGTDATFTYSGITIVDPIDNHNRVFYRYVQSGDTATFTAASVNSNAFNCAIWWEVTGVTGVFATDLENSVADNTTADPVVSTALTTANANDLGIAYFEKDSGADPTTLGTGWTVDGHATGSGYGHIGGSQVFAASSSNVQINAAYGGGGTRAYIVLLFKGTAAAPTPSVRLPRRNRSFTSQLIR